MAEVEGTAAPAQGSAVAEQAVTESNGTESPQQDVSLLDWRSALTPMQREDATVKRYTTVQGAIQGLIEANRKLGSSVQVPGEDAKPEDWDRFHERLGRPKTPADYEITPPALPEGEQWDTEFERQYREQVHALGLNQGQAQKLLQWYYETYLPQRANMEQGLVAMSAQDAEKELARRFGASAPRKIQAAQHFFENLGIGAVSGPSGQRTWEKMIAAGLANDPDIIETFARAGELLVEDPLFDADHALAGSVTPDSIEKQIQVLQEKKWANGALNEVEHQQLWKLLESQQRWNDRSMSTSRR